MSMLFLIAAIIAFLLAALLSIADGDLLLQPIEFAYVGLTAFAAAFVAGHPSLVSWGRSS